MPSAYESFWTHESYAFVGHSKKMNFPKISFGEAKKQKSKVFAVDPSADTILEEKTYPDLKSLPEKVEAVVLEVPKDEVLSWVQQVVDAGIKNLWIHMECDTPEAVKLAKDNGINVLTGTCAVMYLKQGFSYHSIHKWIMKMLKKY